MADKKPEHTPEGLAKMLNARAEENERVKAFAQKTGVAMMAFIASYIGVRISPIEQHSAQIGLLDEFGVEEITEKLRATKAKKLYLLVNSPGGSMSSSYKIAKAIRKCFDEITVFVPHMAASGGTMLALAGNEIVMGPMSQLSPLDVQLRYKGTSVSAAVANRFFFRSKKWFEKMTPEEAPYPQRAMTDKLDPFVYEEWEGTMETERAYVEDILNLSGYKDKSLPLALKLVHRYTDHDYVISLDEAKEIGLNIVDSKKHREAWDVMRHWLSLYIFEQELMHCIRYAIPEKGKEKRQNASKTKNKSKGDARS